MIIVTGAAGFIGSCMVNKLNNKGHKELVLVDDFSKSLKNKNINHKTFLKQVHRDQFKEWLKDYRKEVQFIIHLGARTDTTEFDRRIFDELNLNYSKSIWNLSSEFQIPLIYASSAATYGMGELGYDDNHEIIDKLKPLNPYGESKNEFDRWVIRQQDQPPFWAGLKFFNVYGPNEYHKGRMASVIFHSFNQIMATGQSRLFRSNHPDYEDGKQLRDFIYIKDVINVIYYMMNRRPASGIYNLGTGKARTFRDLAGAVFRAMNKEEKIEFIPIPEDISQRYQNFTEAKMEKLRQAGYDIGFYTLEEGIDEYVKGYLTENRYF
ncbi:MAG: ADP-glyceromanno-heptose 6-epimerase [Bacteroidales bacterium]|nr:ADP-glyceromanno-heptose 6-epimerase [Lentimicrobiaceae bacterium]MDD5694486.1 ADP-glyceromanno-heptose 6-epimerase [Bacteroidales bacterium]